MSYICKIDPELPITEQLHIEEIAFSIAAKHDLKYIVVLRQFSDKYYYICKMNIYGSEWKHRMTSLTLRNLASKYNLLYLIVVKQ